MRKTGVLALAVLLAITGVAVIGPQASASPPAAATLGMRPSSGFLDADRLAKYERALGSQINWYVGFAGRNNPGQMRSAVYGQMLADTAVLPRLRNRMNVVMTVPLAFGSGSARTDKGRAAIRKNLKETASGKWDEHYRIVAQNLVKGGYPDAVVRLGHEHTGGWFPWSSIGNADAYIEAYRHVHKVFRKVSPQFKFEWNGAKYTWKANGPQAYPGDAYVDYVGLDFYYEPKGGSSGKWSDDIWKKNYLSVLQHHFQFAKSKGKPVAYSEWAMRGVDEPRFIEEMYRWFSSLPKSGPGHLAYQVLFNPTQKDYDLDRYPKSKAKYLELFSGRRQPAPPPQSPVTQPPAGNPPAAQPPASSSGAGGALQVATRMSVKLEPSVQGSNYRWWKVSGPGGVEWSNRAAAKPTVSFRSPGTYRLRVRATSGLRRSVETITINVTKQSQSGQSQSGGTSASPKLSNDVAVRVSDARAQEGKTLAFQVRLSQPAGDSVKVWVRTRPGTAKSGKDYRKVYRSVVIPAGKRAATVNVKTINDRNRESNEKMYLEIVRVDGATIAGKRGTGVIR